MVDWLVCTFSEIDENPVTAGSRLVLVLGWGGSGMAPLE